MYEVKKKSNCGSEKKRYRFIKKNKIENFINKESNFNLSFKKKYVAINKNKSVVQYENERTDL